MENGLKPLDEIFAERDRRRDAEVKARREEEDRNLARAALKRIAEPKIGQSSSDGMTMTPALIASAAMLLMAS